MNKKRNWTVLLVGGASGIGKSTIVSSLAKFYKVNVLEVDDIFEAVKAVSNKELVPTIHGSDEDVDWMALGVEGNLQWLKDVSGEMTSSIQAVIDNHLETGEPIIIEGDFIHPEIMKLNDNTEVKCVFLFEADREQIISNYLSREGGNKQCLRADISVAYGKWHSDTCGPLNLPMIEARPWNTVIDRINKVI